MTTPDTMLTAREAADRAGVSVRTLDRWIAEGLITPRRATPRSHRKFLAREVDALHGASAEGDAAPNGGTS